MKKLMILSAVTVAAGCAFAWPCGPCGPGWGHCPPPPPHHWGGGFWGRGGCNFWPGFVGGVVGGLATSAICAPRYQYVAPTPVVVQQPVVTTPVVVQTQPVVVSRPVVTAPAVRTTQQNVWIEGRYVDQVQANGSVVRVWNPGHYETRTVLCQ